MSIHIGAEPGQIAETILLPGDPLRAKWIAENFLEDVIQYNSIRGMLGFTGTYKGKRISTQGTGMGAPSISIYVQELFNDYGVQSAIRVGTCGGLSRVKLRDIIIGIASSTDSAINARQTRGLTYAPHANYELLEAAVNAARGHGASYHVGALNTGDMFYDTTDAAKILDEYGVLGLEMESAALYTLAARIGRRALAICTVSDMVFTHEATPAEEREQGFRNMVEIALEAAINA